MNVNRRRLLGQVGAVGIATVLGGCGFTRSDGGSDGSGDSLTFTTWGTDSELAAFRAAIARFEKERSGARVLLNAVPYEQMFTNIDAQIQAGNAPDIFRVPYYTFGSYAGKGQLLDIGKHIDASFAQRFTPAAWQAVQNNGRPFGVPHHTDTSVILYNRAALDAAGVGGVPTTLDTAWTWEEFEAVAQKLRDSLPPSRFPFAYNWQGNGVTRWLSLLFEADGRFLADDLVSPAIDSPAGRTAVDFSKSFFPRRFVPPNSSVKSTTYAADLWYSQTVAMTFGGAFLIPDAVKNVKDEWGATFAPRKVRSAGDFGGNALVATAGTKNPALATAFLDFMTGADPMRDFCASSSLLPTRQDLVSGGIEFAVRPELSPVFIGQAGSVRAADSGQVASPSMSAIITVLKDQLELAFVGGQSTAATLAGLSTGIAAATARR